MWTAGPYRLSDLSLFALVLMCAHEDPSSTVSPVRCIGRIHYLCKCIEPLDRRRRNNFMTVQRSHTILHLKAHMLRLLYIAIVRVSLDHLRLERSGELALLSLFVPSGGL